jgi:hypothetical protein
LALQQKSNTSNEKNHIYKRTLYRIHFEKIASQIRRAHSWSDSRNRRQSTKRTTYTNASFIESTLKKSLPKSEDLIVGATAEAEIEYKQLKEPHTQTRPSSNPL